MDILTIHPGWPDYLHSMTLHGLHAVGCNIYEYQRNHAKIVGIDDHLDFPLMPENLCVNDFDFCLIHPLPADLCSSVPGDLSKCTTVLLDGSDNYTMCFDSIGSTPPSYIFKREFLLNRRYQENCYPCPFSYPAEKILPINASHGHDITFLVAPNHPRRHHVYQALCREPHLSMRGSIGSHLPHNIYMSTLHMGRVGVSVRGFGYDTVRFYETLAAGAMLLTDESPLIMPNPFIDDEHLAYFDENTLSHIVNHYLSLEATRKEIAFAGQNHLKQYHTTLARAEYMLNIIESGC